MGTEITQGSGTWGRGRRTRWAAATIIVMATIVIAGPPSAGAFAWRTGADSLGCDRTIENSADSISHGYHYNSNLSSVMATATSWVRTAVIDPSDINTFTVPVLAVDTDVVVYDQNYTDWCNYSWHPGSGGLSVLGSTNCESLATNPANACEKHEVRYDESYTGSATTTQRRWVACHENGHTLGLQHHLNNDGSCLWTWSPNTSFSSPDYTNINLHYN
jgi:hypothetical protein